MTCYLLKGIEEKIMGSNVVIKDLYQDCFFGGCLYNCEENSGLYSIAVVDGFEVATKVGEISWALKIGHLIDDKYISNVWYYYYESSWGSGKGTPGAYIHGNVQGKNGCLWLYNLLPLGGLNYKIFGSRFCIEFLKKLYNISLDKICESNKELFLNVFENEYPEDLKIEKLL